MKKPLPTAPNYANYIAHKQKRLLTWAKDNVKLAKGSDDAEIFMRETANYLAAQGKVARVAPQGSGKGFRWAVRTSMFGGQFKHVNTSAWRRAVKELRPA